MFKTFTPFDTSEEKRKMFSDWIERDNMKIAILMCGQMREFKHCVESFKDHVLKSMPNADIFCETQDCNANKPLLGNGMHNQYLYTKLAPAQIERELEHHFGKNLKHVNVEPMFESYIENQKNNFQCHTVGYIDTFKSLEAAFSKALSSETSYDLFIRVRPDTFFMTDMYIDGNTFLQKKSKPVLFGAGFVEGFTDHIADIFFITNRLGMEKVLHTIKNLKMNKAGEILVEEGLGTAFAGQCVFWKNEQCLVFKWILSKLYLNDYKRIDRMCLEDRKYIKKVYDSMKISKFVF